MSERGRAEILEPKKKLCINTSEDWVMPIASNSCTYVCFQNHFQDRDYVTDCALQWG